MSYLNRCAREWSQFLRKHIIWLLCRMTLPWARCGRSCVGTHVLRGDAEFSRASRAAPHNVTASISTCGCHSPEHLAVTAQTLGPATHVRAWWALSRQFSASAREDIAGVTSIPVCTYASQVGTFRNKSEENTNGSGYDRMRCR